MLSWFKKNKKFIKIRAVENEIGMPHDILQKAVLDKQGLPKKWIKPLENWYKEFIKKE